MPGDDGRVCAKLNDLPQAKQHLEEALKIDEKLRIFTPAERVEIPEITSKSGILDVADGSDYFSPKKDLTFHGPNAIMRKVRVL